MAETSLFGMFPEWLKSRASKLFDYLCIWNSWQVAALTGALLSVWGLSRLSSAHWWQSLAMPVGVAIQLLVFWFQWTPWSDPEMPYDKHPLIPVLQREVGMTGRLAQENFSWGGGYFDPNVLAPLGVVVARGYDGVLPHGMKSPTGLPWDFPGSTHFLGKIGERSPDGWTETWSDGKWRLLRKPEQSVGMIRGSSGTLQLPRENFTRPTLNTMEARVPPGTTKLTLFSNWDRGWYWRGEASADWKQTGCSGDRCVEVVFDQPLPADSRIYFRFSPAPPVWVSIVTGLSLLGISGLAVFGRGRLVG